MKNSFLILILLVAGCALPYNKLKHNTTPYHTKGAYRLSVAIEKLIRKRYNGPNTVPFITSATMPADEFIDTSKFYNGKQVSFSARIETDDSDIIRLIWDYQPMHFLGSVPQPLLFPYPHEVNYTNSRYFIKYVPVAEFQKLKPEHVWDNSSLIAGLKFKEILYNSGSEMEPASGFINKNYPELYNNCFSSLGIIQRCHLLNGKTVRCYLITSDLYDNTTPHYVRWKIKV